MPHRPAESSDYQHAIATLHRFAALATHPDRQGGDTATMKRVNAAAELLRATPSGVGRLEPCHRAHVERPAYRFLPWGRFKGEPMSETPISYLAWVVENVVDDSDTREAARAWLHWRSR